MSDRILWILQREPGALGAYQLAQKLTVETGRPHHPNSIYRVLDTLRAQRQVLAVASARGWVINRVAIDGAVIAMLCVDCGSAAQLPAGEIEADIATILAQRRFKPRLVHLEVLGRCRACADRSPGS